MRKHSKHLLVFKTSWSCLTDIRHVLKTSSTRLQHNIFSSSKRSSRRLKDIYWRCLLTNLNLYLTNRNLTKLRKIQNALIRTQYFDIHLILNLKQHFFFMNWNLWRLLGVVKLDELRIHWRLLTILKTRNKSAWSNVFFFWYLKLLYSESLFNTLYPEIKYKCQKNFLWTK